MCSCLAVDGTVRFHSGEEAITNFSIDGKTFHGAERGFSEGTLSPWQGDGELAARGPGSHGQGDLYSHEQWLLWMASGKVTVTPFKETQLYTLFKGEALEALPAQPE